MIKLPTPLSLETIINKIVGILNNQLTILGSQSPAPTYEIKGPKAQISGLSSIEEAGPGDLCFAVAEKYLTQALEKKVAAVIVSPKLAEIPTNVPLVITSDPRLYFVAALSIA